MDKQLNLTDDQRERIDKIFKESQERTKPLWDKVAPQFKEELRHVREQIRGELTPEQQKKFEEALKPKLRKDDKPGDELRRRVPKGSNRPPPHAEPAPSTP